MTQSIGPLFVGLVGGVFAHFHPEVMESCGPSVVAAIVVASLIGYIFGRMKGK